MHSYISLVSTLQLSSCFLQQGVTLTFSVHDESNGELVTSTSQNTFDSTDFPLDITNLPRDQAYNSTVTVSNKFGTASLENITFSECNRLLVMCWLIDHHCWCVLIQVVMMSRTSE